MQQLQLDGSPIVYYVSGRNQNEWVLFLHAAFVDHGMFQTQIDCFGDRYNVLTLDLLGHGKSTAAQKGDDLGKMSAWIHEILKKEHIDRIHIVGVSLGAVLAQDFANQYPDAVHSLACFGGYDINNFDASLQKENSAAQMLMMFKAFVSIRWFAEANKKISAYTPQAQNDFYEMNLRFPKKSFLYFAALGRMINVRHTEPRKYPLLIGCGRHDAPMARTAIEQWKDHEPQCRVIFFDNAGHCVNMDVPQRFNAAMEEFWATAALRDEKRTDTAMRGASK